MNRTKTPVVEIELEEGHIRHLCFDYNALAEIQDLGYELENVNLANLVEKIETAEGKPEQVKLKKGSLKLVRDLAWAALVSEDPRLTPLRVGQLISEVGAEYVLKKLTEAFGLAMAEPEPVPLGESLPAPSE